MERALAWFGPNCTHPLTSRAKEGANELEVTVVNPWTARLMGDVVLPEKERVLMKQI
jgi:hypothetical protein